MATLPVYSKKTAIRHEWEIGPDGEEHSIARTLEDGLYFAKQQMQKLGLDVSSDDCYRWRSGDGASIVIYVDVEEES